MKKVPKKVSRPLTAVELQNVIGGSDNTPVLDPGTYVIRITPKKVV